MLHLRSSHFCLLIGFQCDTFSRSNEAVFELSTRFCEEVQLANHLSSAERLEALRLMFIELTQGKHAAYTEALILLHLNFSSLSLGQLYRSLSPYQHD